MIEYKIENELDVEEFRQILVESTLGLRRPVDDPERLSKMLKYGNLIITARNDGKLVGVARSITDFSFCTYLSDLAVSIEYQKKGIGRELIRRTKEESSQAKLILLSAPNAVNYYPKIGMKLRDHCYILDDIDDLK